MSKQRIITPSQSFRKLLCLSCYLCSFVVEGFRFLPSTTSLRRLRIDSPLTTDCFQRRGRTIVPGGDSNQVLLSALLAFTRNQRVDEPADGRNFKQKQHLSQQQRPAPRADAEADESPIARRGKRGKGADSYLLAVHKERLKHAGRVGTKRFVDPCKVFCGNLPFDCTEEDLRQFFQQHLSHSAQEIHNIQIVKDWKTSQSKGYAFCRFTDPIFATVAMDKCSGKELGGRPIVVRQGKKKDQDSAVYVKKNKKLPQETEEAAIQQGLDQTLDEESRNDEAEDKTTTEWIALDDNEENDDFLFGDDDEYQSTEDDDFDGVFEEMYPLIVEEANMTLNREQRRNSTRTKKRRKLPNKGFGEKQPSPNTDKLTN